MEGKNQFGREGIFVDNNTFFNTSISAVCLLRQFAAASLHVVFFLVFNFACKEVVLLQVGHTFIVFLAFICCFVYTFVY